jgi:hypothetical protein
MCNNLTYGIVRLLCVHCILALPRIAQSDPGQQTPHPEVVLSHKITSFMERIFFSHNLFSVTLIIPGNIFYFLHSNSIDYSMNLLILMSLFISMCRYLCI